MASECLCMGGLPAVSLGQQRLLMVLSIEAPMNCVLAPQKFSKYSSLNSELFPSAP